MRAGVILCIECRVLAVVPPLGNGGSMNSLLTPRVAIYRSIPVIAMPSIPMGTKQFLHFILQALEDVSNCAKYLTNDDGKEKVSNDNRTMGQYLMPYFPVMMMMPFKSIRRKDEVYIYLRAVLHMLTRIFSETMTFPRHPTHPTLQFELR